MHPSRSLLVKRHQGGGGSNNTNNRLLQGLMEIARVMLNNPASYINDSCTTRTVHGSSSYVYSLRFRLIKDAATEFDQT